MSYIEQSKGPRQQRPLLKGLYFVMHFDLRDELSFKWSNISMTISWSISFCFILMRRVSFINFHFEDVPIIFNWSNQSSVGPQAQVSPSAIVKCLALTNFGLWQQAIAEDVGSKKILTYVISLHQQTFKLNLFLNLKVVHYSMFNFGYRMRAIITRS